MADHRYAQLNVRSHFNMNINASAIREVPWTMQNGTRGLIANLRLEKVQTVRTMHLTLGAFSLALTLLTVHRIISDSRRAAAVQYAVRRRAFHFLQAIHPAETFPLVLACGAVIQQIIFISVQATSLRSIYSNNCQGLAMIVFPAIFIIGYITFVFGIEMAIRGLFYDFKPRGRWNTPICLAIIAFLHLMTWMPTIIWPTYPRCFGSLALFPMRYEVITLVIVSVLIFTFLLLAVLISTRLMRTSIVDANERIAASRMCYYLLSAAFLYILIIPLQVQTHRKDFMKALATSRIAEVALFTSGIVLAFFHLFSRVNAARMVINPIKGASSDSRQKRPKIRFFGPSDLEMNISGPLALQGPRPDSRQGLIDVGPEKNRYEFDPEYFERPLSPGSPKSLGSVDPSKWPLPPDPSQQAIAADSKDTADLHKRTKSSYSLFPTRAEDVPRLPATVYSPSKFASSNQARRGTGFSSMADTKSVTDISEAFNFLSKPAALFSGRHGRLQSTDSSATVQIGLRFSLAPAMLAATKYPDPLQDHAPAVPSLRRDGSGFSGETLGLPIQSPFTNPSPFTPSKERSTTFPEPPQPVLSPSTYLQSQRDKLLPPTPRSTRSEMPPATQPAPLNMSGLRMNPIATSSPATFASASSSMTRSPTARIPLGAGTMARSPPPNGWI